jgi:hypothetical protein
MWKYYQRTGFLFAPDGKCVAYGYSGHAEGKNNPSMQDVHNIGPIPRGFYEIGEPHDTDTHGPYVLRLTPFPENEMFGRAGFLIHGDSKANPGTASQGCIILPADARHRIWGSEAHIIEVLA